MSQPPYPPQGGSSSGDDQPGSRDWPAGGSDDPTRRFDAPPGGGQREHTRQFPGGSFGQPPYGQPGQLPYGQPGQPYGQPGQQPYGQPPYGQPPYGSPGHPGPGQPGGPPGGPGQQGPKKNTGLVLALVVAAVVVLVAAAGGLFFLLRTSDPGPDVAATAAPPTAVETTAEQSPEPAPEPSPTERTDEAPSGGQAIPPATVPPVDLGDDPALDQLAEGCHDGDMQACDDLYMQSEPDSLYELYGGTCAGRQDVSDSDAVFCTTAFPEA